jgi:hypothetical protein
VSDPCGTCDTIGPFTRDEQELRDMHRAWHDLGRVVVDAFRELHTAFTRTAEAARTATTANYALIPNDVTEEPMPTTPAVVEVWRVEVNDDVTLTRKMGTIAGRVTRIDASATKGTGLYLYGRGLPYWVGPQHDTWILTDHRPAIPTVLRVGARYHVMTSDDRHFQAHWSPIDGIRANHPWLHPDGETRYRQDLIVRARLADTEGNDQ